MFGSTAMPPNRFFIGYMQEKYGMGQIKWNWVTNKMTAKKAR